MALYVALGITLLIRYQTALREPWLIHKTPFTVVFIIWILFFFIAGLYDQSAWTADRSFRERFIRTMIASTAVAVILFYLIEAFGITPKTNLLIQAILTVLLILGWRIGANHIIRRSSKTNILFFGISDEVLGLAHTLKNNPHFGYYVSLLVDDGEKTASLDSSLPIIEFNTTVQRHIKEKQISLIVASRDIRSNREFVIMLYEALPLGIQVVDFPTFYESLTGKIPTSLISEIWFLENLVGIRKRAYEFSKRFFDIILGIMLGVVFLALLPVIILGILLSTPKDIWHHKKRRARKGDGRIFFRQRRVGKNGKEFDFLKFRSQRLGSEQMSGVKDMQNDPRVYPFGTFLRMFYLDELPQIWNVLKGDMSLIGPRPERPHYVAELREKIPFYDMRLLVTPGITGWAQVNMENDASVEDAPQKMQYDLYYIKNRSLVLDLTIALKTIAVLLSREGR